MTEVASGSSVGRRLNELQNALDIAPPPVTSSLSQNPPDRAADQLDQDFDDGDDAFEDVTDVINQDDEAKRPKIGLGITPLTLVPKTNGTASEVDATARAATPTTPTNTASSQISLLTSSTGTTKQCSAQNTPTSAPCYMELALDAVPPLPPLPEPLHDPSRASVSTLSSVSTPDVDRFSTVQLKTPTSSSGNDEMFTTVTHTLPHLNIGTTNGGGTISPLHDDEQDLATAGFNYVDPPPPSTREDLRIRTDLAREREDNLRTPVAGLSAASPQSRRHSVSTKPLAEGVELLLARMEKENADPKAARRSIEGREKLKGDFSRLQVSPNTAAFPKSPSRKIGGSNGFPGSGPDEKIDWDFWGDVIANYEHVARTKSEKLAAAIQKGIPPALRGMVWQL
ncbi:GTPase-activating protein, partial [Tulasnella sp. 427]